MRYKHQLTGEGAPVQLAVIPFLKLPTAADGLGNDKVEGGLAVPISFALADPVTMTLGPEFDLLADADGRHLALANLINLSLPIAPRWAIVGELWTNFNFDPGGTVEQASVDAALTYAFSLMPSQMICSLMSEQMSGSRGRHPISNSMQDCRSGSERPRTTVRFSGPEI